MTTRTRLAIAGVAPVVLMAFVTVAGQNQPPEVKGSAPAAGWVQPRTPDGQPDIQGMWTNYTNTPFEVFDQSDRPDFYGGDIDGRGAGTGPNSFLNDMQGRKFTKGRALVVDPPSGRVPIMEWAEKQRDYRLLHIQDDWVNFTPWERCITRGVPGGIFPPGYGAGYQIVQGPGYVAIIYEMIHEARMIPVDGRPHLHSNVKLWNGDSRGRWEGNTLVVDVTNYNDKGNVATNVATQRVRSIPQSDQLHVVERFTRVDEKTINYEATIEDPKVFTAPWKVAMPMTLEPDYKMFEYACHEGNHAVPNTLSAGRAADKGTRAKTSQ
ncbi:MAG: hypothetical protein FJW27_01800 [Acidimicrobiia bacterium]|nr:hypothetical protein [Acidimicrobiia bacterium]